MIDRTSTTIHLPSLQFFVSTALDFRSTRIRNLFRGWRRLWIYIGVIHGPNHPCPDNPLTSSLNDDLSDAERVGLSRLFHRTSRSKNASLTTIDNNNQALDERGQKLVGPNGENGIHDSEGDLLGLSERSRELANARRVLRMAGWSQVFYLVTCGSLQNWGKKENEGVLICTRWEWCLNTDILGPFNAPFAIASIGLVPGVLLYVSFSHHRPKVCP